MNFDPKTPASVPGASAPGSYRILLVEDSPEVRETTVEFVTELGHQVVAVETAEAALSTLAHERFDIVMTDVSLPGISGIDMLKRIRATDASQRFVIVSGYGDDFREHAFGGGVAVLAKPYDFASLERTLNSLAT